MLRSPSSVVWALALTCSLALHGTVLALGKPTADSARGHEVSGEFEFVELPAPTPPAPPPAPVVTPTPAPRPAPPVRAPVRQAQAAEPAPPPPTPDVPRAASPSDAPTSRAPLALTPALLPSGTFALSLDAGAPAAEDVPRGLHAVEAPTDLVGSVARSTIGRGRVERGLVHPYYSQLGKSLIKHWDADRVAKAGLKGFTEQAGENFKLANEIWANQAAVYGRSGAPIDAESLGTNRRAPVNTQIQGINPVDLDSRKELQRKMGEIYRATRRATLRVVQDKAGKLVKVELVEPSNDANVDREALKDVRAAAERLPPPPEEVFEGKDHLSSLWSFELIVSISPPIPTITFEFDEALGFIDTRLPLDRRIYKKVRLVAVE